MIIKTRFPHACCHLITVVHLYNILHPSFFAESLIWTAVNPRKGAVPLEPSAAEDVCGKIFAIKKAIHFRLFSAKYSILFN